MSSAVVLAGLALAFALYLRGERRATRKVIAGQDAKLVEVVDEVAALRSAGRLHRIGRRPRHPPRGANEPRPPASRLRAPPVRGRAGARARRGGARARRLGCLGLLVAVTAAVAFLGWR
jgi:hypothetical protein